MSENEIISKMSSEKLSYDEITYMINGYVNKTIDDDTMALFIKNIYDNGFSNDELFYLTDAMIKSGSTIDFSDLNVKVVDKHSTGGIGDKTTLIVGPIVASLGLGVPKMSGRGLGFTGGTVDKLESIDGYNVNLTLDEFKKQIDKIGVSVISQTENMCIADKKIYALRDERGYVDSIPLIASSIMSKKIASGSPNIIIDLKLGKGAFMKDLESATELAKVMIEIGKYYNRKVICALTDMNYPLGRAIGNAVEVKEVIEFFDGKYDERLKRICFYLSALMVSISNNISVEEALKLVDETYENGNARKKFYEWISYQNGNITSLKDNAQKMDIKSDKTGYINNVDSLKLAELCKNLGAGRSRKEDSIDYAAGVYLNKTIGDKVEKGDILGTIYYNKEIKDMQNIFIESFELGNEKKKEKDIIIKVVE